jgi:hypothetical protein
MLSTSYLREEPEWRRAYSILGFILHAYVWGGTKPAEVFIHALLDLHLANGTRESLLN